MDTQSSNFIKTFDSTLTCIFLHLSSRSCILPTNHWNLETECKLYYDVIKKWNSLSHKIFLIILETNGQTEKPRGSSVNFVYSVANSNDSKAEKILKRGFRSNKLKMHKTGIDVWVTRINFLPLCHGNSNLQLCLEPIYRKQLNDIYVCIFRNLF